MSKIKSWYELLTFGEGKRYNKFLLWMLLDSFVMTLPYGFVILAIYVFMYPLMGLTNSIPETKAWILAGILLAQAVTYFLIRQKSYIYSCTGMVKTMRNSRLKLGEHLRKLPMGFFDSRDAGDISTVFLRDYDTVEQLSDKAFPQFAITFVRVLMSVIMMAIFDYRMAIALFITIPFALPFAFLSYKKFNVTNDNLMKSNQKAASGILEYVGGIKTLKAFNLAGEKFSTLKETLNNQKNYAIEIETKTAAPLSIAGRAVLNLGIVFTILFGGFLTISLKLNPFFYIAFLIMSVSMYEPIVIFFIYLVDFARCKKSGDRITKLFEEKALDAEGGDKTINDSTLEMENVSFSYSKKEVLHDVSLKFPANTITALVGPSGSGKSTITRLIARFWDVNKGEVKIGGVPLTALSSDQVLEKIAMVFQDVYLFHDTIEANIRMGNETATKEEVYEAAKKAACHDFIMSLPEQYSTIIGEGGSTLSGGEKQRISIARALLKDAPIILLDEATASLDPENEVLIQRAISNLVKGKTVIIVAHRLRSVCNADNIYVINDGKIEESGTHSVLLEKNGLYAKLWNEQTKAGNWKLSEE
ncbi:MAG: ABC transporter ATP-binding protein/permease [Treponemataceae bacterium]|nr:ABC transporter ATP-binding protein/permease [Treponemataceae bacterium]